MKLSLRHYKHIPNNRVHCDIMFSTEWWCFIFILLTITTPSWLLHRTVHSLLDNNAQSSLHYRRQRYLASDHDERPAGGPFCGWNAALGAGLPVHGQVWRGWAAETTVLYPWECTLLGVWPAEWLIVRNLIQRHGWLLSHDIPGWLLSHDIPDWLLSHDIPGWLLSRDIPGWLLSHDIPGWLLSHDIPGWLLSHDTHGYLQPHDWLLWNDVSTALHCGYYKLFELIKKSIFRVFS